MIRSFENSPEFELLRNQARPTKSVAIKNRRVIEKKRKKCNNSNCVHRMCFRLSFFRSFTIHSQIITFNHQCNICMQIVYVHGTELNIFLRFNVKINQRITNANKSIRKLKSLFIK